MNRTERRQRQAAIDAFAATLPETMTRLTDAELEAHLGPTGAPRRVWPVAAWRSRRFVAQLFDHDAAGARLSIKRNDDGDGIGWDDLQRIKSECGFGKTWMIEVYPADADVVNVANMRHLWLTDPVGWVRG